MRRRHLIAFTLRIGRGAKEKMGSPILGQERYYAVQEHISAAEFSRDVNETPKNYIDEIGVTTLKAGKAGLKKGLRTVTYKSLGRILEILFSLNATKRERGPKPPFPFLERCSNLKFGGSLSPASHRAHDAQAG